MLPPSLRIFRWEEGKEGPRAPSPPYHSGCPDILAFQNSFPRKQLMEPRYLRRLTARPRCVLTHPPNTDAEPAWK